MLAFSLPSAAFEYQMISLGRMEQHMWLAVHNTPPSNLINA